MTRVYEMRLDDPDDGNERADAHVQKVRSCWALSRYALYHGLRARCPLRLFEPLAEIASVLEQAGDGATGLRLIHYFGKYPQSCVRKEQSQMPVYEYVCNHCDDTFDRLVRSMTSTEAVTCEHCASEDVRRVPSRFASLGGLDDPMTPMQSSGGCCGGSCGCGH